MEISQPGSSSSCLIMDSGLSPDFLESRWFSYETSAFVRKCPPGPFCFASAINTGIKNLRPGQDILVLNDDTEIVTPDWLVGLEHILKNTKSGLISLAIEGGVGNPEQRADRSGALITLTTKTLCFVAMLIRHTAWSSVGPLDERFTGYGFDDDDYCRRMREAGWLTGVTQQVIVKHGAGGMPHSSSYRRYHGQEVMDRMFHENQARYIDKWGGPPSYERTGKEAAK